MNSSISASSRRQAAVATGIALLLMAVAAGFSLAFVMEQLIDLESPSRTLSQLKDSAGLFRAGIFGWGIVFVCDLIAAWGLHTVLAKINPALSLLTAWFRIGYTVMLGIAISYLVAVLPLLDQSADLPSMGWMQNQALLYIESFHGIWSFGLIVFGLHLLGLGWLALQSGQVPRWIATLLLVAGVAYFGIHSAQLLFPAFESYKATVEMVLGLPMALGELALAGWLLWKGGKSDG